MAIERGIQMYTITGNTFKISVRALVEFVYSSGDIDNRDAGVPDVKVMQEGARMHRKIQHQMGASYRAEVPLKHTIDMHSDICGDYNLYIEGRADGIICDLSEDEDGEKTPTSPVTIDEIKTTQENIDKIEKAYTVHEAQAKVYGYIYALKHNLDDITIQMTYCNPDTERIKRFSENYTFDRIKEWFENTIKYFSKWTDFVFEQRKMRNDSIKSICFPFEYREEQKKLVLSVYKAIDEEQHLFIQAPTGVGKTISTLYPSIQAMGHEKADKIFYLTSKTITRKAAEDTYSLLRNKGLHFRTVTLTAKDKICHLDERNCNPVACSYAKGHFDRINEAVYDVITNEQVIDRDKILEYSVKHNVCPYELSLDISYWCDGIICDYNYVFDPDVGLKRYFANGGKGDYIFLVDEAHNLVDRARQMYSAVIVKEDFLQAKKIVKDMDKRLASSLEKCNKLLLSYKRECDDYKVLDNLGILPMELERLFSCMQKFMDKHKGSEQAAELLDFFFEVRHFLNMYDCMDEKYIIYSEHTDNGFCVRLFCADPSGNISERLSQGKSCIFFSATLLPVNYFKEMLSGDVDDYAVYAHSSFHPDNKRVVIGNDISSKYTRRNEREYMKAARYIKAMLSGKRGKYLVFFPSYSYMRKVYEIFVADYNCNEISIDSVDDDLSYMISDGINLVMQTGQMKENDKEKFLDMFRNTDDDICMAGFCVSGGMFSEGIDLKNDNLIGVAVIGTGIPMVCRENNILKDFFDKNGRDGYKYAYMYPGMNKVLQACGRVIRTETDRGVILLLDERFLEKEYEKLYPREWNKIFVANMNSVSTVLDDFWNDK